MNLSATFLDHFLELEDRRLSNHNLLVEQIRGQRYMNLLTPSRTGSGPHKFRREYGWFYEGCA